MDDALRCLRDGVVNGRSAPFVLLQDSSDVLGGPAVAAKVLETSVDQMNAAATATSCIPCTWRLLLVLCMAHDKHTTANHVHPCIRHVAAVL
jgi:hypothetical protein